MLVVGIDPAVRNTGVAVLWRRSSKDVVVATRNVRYCGKPFKNLTCVARLKEVKSIVNRAIEAALELCRQATGDAPIPVDSVVVEGHPMGSRSNSLVNLVEVAAALKLSLIESGVRFIFEPAPTSVKKFATDNGRATKSEVRSAVESRLGLDGNATEHECDAVACAWMRLVDAGIVAPAEHQRAYVGWFAKGVTDA